MAKSKPEMLSETAPAVSDSRPRFEPCRVDELGGPLRIRRLEAEQIVAIKTRFEMHGINSARPTLTKENKFILRKLVQVSLVPENHYGLLLRGDAGFTRLAVLSDDTLQRVAEQIILFNELA